MIMLHVLSIKQYMLLSFYFSFLIGKGVKKEWRLCTNNWIEFIIIIQFYPHNSLFQFNIITEVLVSGLKSSREVSEKYGQAVGFLINRSWVRTYWIQNWLDLHRWLEYQIVILTALFASLFINSSACTIRSYSAAGFSYSHVRSDNGMLIAHTSLQLTPVL